MNGIDPLNNHFSLIEAFFVKYGAFGSYTILQILMSQSSFKFNWIFRGPLTVKRG
jgi:hypothetical protein